MEFREDFLAGWLKRAPTALAVERTLECEILARQEFERPVLDLGCGDGLFSHLLFGETIEVGVDPDGEELRRARRCGAHKELIQCSGDCIPRAANSFNTIFSNSVFEHIRDLEPVVREAHRLLAPGGRLYVTVPTDRFDNYSVVFQLLSSLQLPRLAERYRRFFDAFWKHYHYYDAGGWERLFARCGFETVAVREYASKRVCLFNDAVSPLAVVSLVEKRLFDRWFVFGGLRALYAPLLSALVNRLLADRGGGAGCGLVFFSLRKP